MIGIGVWECVIDTIYWKGTARMTIAGDNGKYLFDFTVPDIDLPVINMDNVTEVGGNTLTATATTDAFPGQEAELYLEFGENAFTGYGKVPMLGKIPIKNGRKVG